MAENLSKKPSKSILKNSSSFDTPDTKIPTANRNKSTKGGAKWDEMNIMATLHPPDKDYGHMKIDEPKTPYNFEGLDLDVEALNPDELAAKIREAGHNAPKALQERPSEDEDDEVTPEERAARKDFESKRKKHYNEFYAVKLARKLLEKDEDDDEDDEQQKKEQDDANLQKSDKNDERRRANETPCKPPKNAANRRNKSALDDDTDDNAAKPECLKTRKCGCLDTIRKM